MNTNFQTIHQFGSGISQMVRQATGRDSVESMDMDWVSVEQQKKWIYGEAEGNPAHFITTLPDGIMSLLVGINPVQDLHGYGSPWPAGGGKNLVNIAPVKVTSQTIIGGTFSLKAGTYSFSVTAKNNTSIPGAMRITVNGSQVGSSAGVPANATNRIKIQNITLDSDSSNVGIVINASTAGYDIDISDVQVETGSSSTDYAPYSNICPISGWTECNLTIANGDDDTAADYDSNTFTLEFPDSQTVYGGRLDSLTRVLTAEYAKVTYNGTETWYAYPNFEGYYTNNSLMKKGTRMDGVSNMLKASFNTTLGQKNTMWLGVDSKYIFVLGVYETMGSTLQDFKDYLNTNNLEICFPLAAPIEIQLDPITVQTFIGDNYISADTGPVSVEYKTEEDVP